MGFLDRFRRSINDVNDLLERELLLLTPESDQEPSGVETLVEDRTVSIVGVTDYEGLSVLPAFTSEAALLRWKPQGSRYLGLQGRVVIQLFAHGDWDRMVVDTDSPHAFAVTRAEAVRLLHT